MKKFFLLLVMIVFAAAVGWAITPSTTNNDNSVTDLEFIQDLSPPLVIINLNTNETTFTAVAAKSVMKILSSPNTGYFNANETANYANANEERLMAVAAVKSVMNSILPSRNWGESFNANETANTAKKTCEEKGYHLLFHDVA